MTANRLHCPTCRAPRRSDQVCRRCKSDLGALIALERHADAVRLRARRCYARGWYRQAATLAEELTALEARPEDLRLLACANLLGGDFQAALKAYRIAGIKRCTDT